MKKYLTCAAFVLAALPAAHAQLVVTNDDAAAGQPKAWIIDLSTCGATPLWFATEGWGAAADDANGILYVNNGSILYSWAYNSPNEPVQLGTITSSVDGATLSMVSLAFTNGKLYATRNISSTNNPEALYEIDPATQIATLHTTWPPGPTIRRPARPR